MLGAAQESSQPEEEGRVATVVLHDGQVMTGTLVSESDNSITLMINGIRSTIEHSKIRESYIQPPVEERCGPPSKTTTPSVCFRSSAG